MYCMDIGLTEVQMRTIIEHFTVEMLETKLAS